MPGAGLPKNGQVRCNGEVTGHTDFLASCHSHAVDPANDRLFAREDGIHHVIEKFHVLAVFIGSHAVKFTVFLGIASGAKRIGAGTCKYGSHNAPV